MSRAWSDDPEKQAKVTALLFANWRREPNKHALQLVLDELRRVEYDVLCVGLRTLALEWRHAHDPRIGDILDAVRRARKADKLSRERENARERERRARRADGPVEQLPQDIREALRAWKKYSVDGASGQKRNGITSAPRRE